MILRSKATVGIGFEATLNVILLLFFSPDESEKPLKSIAIFS
jgi:hypothetical protein